MQNVEGGTERAGMPADGGLFLLTPRWGTRSHGRRLLRGRSEQARLEDSEEERSAREDLPEAKCFGTVRQGRPRRRPGNRQRHGGFGQTQYARYLFIFNTLKRGEPLGDSRRDGNVATDGETRTQTFEETHHGQPGDRKSVV